MSQAVDIGIRLVCIYVFCCATFFIQETHIGDLFKFEFNSPKHKVKYNLIDFVLIISFYGNSCPSQAPRISAAARHFCR